MFSINLKRRKIGFIKVKQLEILPFVIIIEILSYLKFEINYISTYVNLILKIYLVILN